MKNKKIWISLVGLISIFFELFSRNLLLCTMPDFYCNSSLPIWLQDSLDLFALLFLVIFIWGMLELILEKCKVNEITMKVLKIIMSIVCILVLFVIIFSITQALKGNPKLYKNFLENQSYYEVNHSFLKKGEKCDEKDFSYEWIDDNTLKIKKSADYLSGVGVLKDVRVFSYDDDFDSSSEEFLDIFFIVDYCKGNRCPEIFIESCSEIVIKNIPRKDYKARFYDFSSEKFPNYRTHAQELEINYISRNGMEIIDNESQGFKEGTPIDDDLNMNQELKQDLISDQNSDSNLIQDSIPVQGNVLMPIMTYRVKNTAFDGCGKIGKYENEPWYLNFSKNLNKYGVDISNISEICLSLDKKLLIAIAIGGYCEPGLIIRYDMPEKIMAKAEFDDHKRGCVSWPTEFGKRNGSIISLQGFGGDGGCSSTMHYEYDYTDNKINLKKEYNKCEGEKVGSWHNY